MKNIIFAAVFIFASSAFAAAGKVSFSTPKDGETVKSPFTVKFHVEGMKVAPAGETVEGSGHHHLLIDGNAMDKGQVIPADEKHLHFGKGQTETQVTLPPGEHTLTLQFADGAHRSYGPEMSSQIKVKVVK